MLVKFWLELEGKKISYTDFVDDYSSAEELEKIKNLFVGEYIDSGYEILDSREDEEERNAQRIDYLYESHRDRNL